MSENQESLSQCLLGSGVSILPTGKLLLCVEPLMGYLGKGACSHELFLKKKNQTFSCSLIKPTKMLDKGLSLTVNIYLKGNRRSNE